MINNRLILLVLSLLALSTSMAHAVEPNSCDESVSPKKNVINYDSYDNYSAVDNLHPKFLSRIAYANPADRTWGEEDGQPCTNNDKGRMAEMIEHNPVLDGDIKKGSYAATPNASDLQALFDNVARRIKLQLIE